MTPSARPTAKAGNRSWRRPSRTSGARPPPETSSSPPPPNDAFCQAHGKGREQILGAAVEDIWGQASFRNIIKSLIDQCFKGDEVHYEAWLNLPVPGRRYLEISYYPYHQRTTVTHAIVVKRD